MLSFGLSLTNSLYIRVSHTALSRLQEVQNAAARLSIGTYKQEYTAPI